MVIRIPLLNVPVQGILPRQQILVEVITNLPYSCGGCPPFIQQHHDRSGTPFPRGPDDGCVLKLQHNDMHVTPISTSSSNNRVHVHYTAYLILSLSPAITVESRPSLQATERAVHPRYITITYTFTSSHLLIY